MSHETPDLDADDFTTQLERLMQNPAFARAYATAKAEMDRAVTTTCWWGNCTVDIDPLTSHIVGGMGPIMCPCDHLPGWRSKYHAGASRPAVPVLARGRHGSRAQRSRRRHALPDWGDLGDWLPARPRPVTP